MIGRIIIGNDLVSYEPVKQASYVIFGTLTHIDTNNHSINVKVTRGSGQRVLVIARSGGSIANYPADGSVYNANLTYGQGDAIGPGYVVYDGELASGTNINITNVPSGTFSVRFFEYNINGYNYKTSAGTYNPRTITIS